MTSRIIPRITKRIVILAGLLIAPLMSHAQTIGLDKVIAIVNNEAITMSEYQARLKREQLGGVISQDISLTEVDSKLLEYIVDERIQAQIAENRGIVVTEEEVDLVAEDMAARNNISVVDLYSQLNDQGVSVQNFRSGIKEQRTIQKVIDLAINSRIVITDQEVDYQLQSYQEQSQPLTDATYELSHLYIATHNLAQQAIQRQRENAESIKLALKQGLKFEKAVADYSDGEEKQSKGYLGWRKDEQLPEIFLAALRETTTGGVTDVIESDNGFHLLKIHDRKGDVKVVTQYFVKHILIQPYQREITDQEALVFIKDIRKKLLSGEDFSKLARLNSDDENSASSGGEMGWINPSTTDTHFEKAIMATPLNSVSEPFRTPFGFHILKATDKRERDISQDLIRQTAYGEVFRRKSQQRFKSWLKRIKDETYIEYLETSS